ncbi:hypothetical protein TNCV_1425611 [Trichonephila clavipes]|nr:hypothetical protein TNCV_1425611 [Trichonephila clavipes]
MFPLCFRLSFRENVLCSKRTSSLLTLFPAFQHGYTSMTLEWNIQSSVPSHLILTNLFVYGVFRQQRPCSVSSFTYTFWTKDGPARGMNARENSDELCSRPLFVNPMSNESCLSGQRWPQFLIIHLYTGVPISFPYINP